MKRFFLLALAIVLVACSGPVGKDDFWVDTRVGSNRTLVVLLPTIGGEGSFYESQGFIKAMRDRGGEGNYKILDIRPSLYLNGRVVDQLKSEVIDPARADGYETIWLVGTSLGGHGALLYLSRHPEDVDYVVVLAPFMADPVTLDAIQDEGGLAKMGECPGIAWDYACNMLVLIKNFTAIPGNERRLAIGFGLDDGFAEQNQLLAEILPQDLVFTVPGGGHDWETWKLLWDQILDHIEAKMAERQAEARKKE